MFKENTKHLQPNLFGLYFSLAPKTQKKLKASEEYFFYQLIFSQIDERIFSVLFSDKKSRPNAPINALVAALILMNRYQWTYEELFKQIQFNILVKVALGIDSLDDLPFSQATIFNFQNRINDHFVRTGENLLEQVFDQLTAEQLKKLKLKTNIQRTDSFAAASNIRSYSRIQLLVELIIRIWRVLRDEDKERFKSHFERYTNKSSGQYIYTLNRSDFPKELEKLGQVYRWIDLHLKPIYKEYDIFSVFEQVYAEHFSIIENKIHIKANDEISSGSMQSPDDLEAAFRKKNDKVVKGQTINIVETAHPDNALNLVTDVDVNPANTDDSVVLNKRLDKIKEKTPDLDELHFDGAYGSEANDLKFEEHDITPVQTAVKGIKAAVEIEIEKTPENEYVVSCPYQSVPSSKARKRFKAKFNSGICHQCPLQTGCPAIKMKRYHAFYFKEKDYLAKKRQRALKKIPPERRKLRSNVEATVNEFTCRMHKKKLKVRGSFKTSVFAYSSALSVNFGRLYRYVASDPGAFVQISYLFGLYFKEHVQKAVNFAKKYINRFKLNLYVNFPCRRSMASCALGW